MSQPQLVSRECKHAVYVRANDGSANDLLVIKEYEHFDDGSKKIHLRQIQNYKRPFWITRESYRKHNDKKEWEKVERLQEFKSTQINLVRNIGRALGRQPQRDDLRMVCRSPYVYGCDVTTPVLAKHHYMKQWPDAMTDNTVAVVDAETDVINGTEEIIMLSITMGTRAKIVVVRDFVKAIHDPEKRILECADKYIGEILKTRNTKLEVEFVKNAGECSYRILKTAHEWKPDILTIWNMNFDIPKMVASLTKYGYDLAEAFSDPSIPPQYRHFKYIEGPAQKVTSSGKTMALHPAEQWHLAECPASFYILDAMCVYLKLRIVKGKEPSYALDAILEKHLGIRKLKFPQADGLYGLKLHQVMQTEYPIEYCVYNIFDCIGLEMLDEKTTDLKRMVSLLCGHSEYLRFPSQPRRTCDDLHFFAQEHGMVAATTSNQMQDELDALVVGLEDWIVTLPSYMVHDDGIQVIEELPDVNTFMRVHVADLDVEGTYPNEQVLFNISKATTAKEVAQIQGISEEIRRAVGINLSGGHVNAVEIVCDLYGAPTLDQLLSQFRQEQMPRSKSQPELRAALAAESQTYVQGEPDLDVPFEEQGQPFDQEEVYTA